MNAEQMRQHKTMLVLSNVRDLSDAQVEAIVDAITAASAVGGDDSIQHNAAKVLLTACPCVLCELARKIAKAFSDALRDCLTDAEWDEMRRRNIAHQDDGICASHDFCDANMVMDPVFTKIVGHEIDGESETLCGIWNAAWDIAKRDYLTANAAEAKS